MISQKSLVYLSKKLNGFNFKGIASFLIAIPFLCYNESNHCFLIVQNYKC